MRLNLFPFKDFLATGQLPDGYLTSEYIAQQFVERFVHYLLMFHPEAIPWVKQSTSRAAGSSAHGVFLKKLKNQPGVPQGFCTSLLWFHEI